MSPLPEETGRLAGISTIVGDESSGFAGGFGEDFGAAVVVLGTAPAVFTLSITTAFRRSVDTAGLVVVSLGGVTAGVVTGADIGAVFVAGGVFAGGDVPATVTGAPGDVSTTPAQR